MQQTILCREVFSHWPVHVRELVAEAMRVVSASSGKIDLRTFTALMLDREMMATKASSANLLGSTETSTKLSIQTESSSATAASVRSTT